MPAFRKLDKLREPLTSHPSPALLLAFYQFERGDGYRTVSTASASRYFSAALDTAHIPYVGQGKQPSKASTEIGSWIYTYLKKKKIFLRYPVMMPVTVYRGSRIQRVAFSNANIQYITWKVLCETKY